ncbi:hypothetical protein V6N12_004399 [Hibiscus sabdariffa]|uniref:Small ribosomal subunit protein uS17 N-terminal domain-containing protein n=1 Tax=Hibiscus sabdariffa TaxID=183260 RepID=A0ABR2CM55_9ROSI
MAGMLAGVECARRRRLHQSGGSSDSAFAFTRRPAFCLYTTNRETQVFSQRKRILVEAYEDQKLGEVARDAKERLDERLRSQRKSEPKRQNRKENLIRSYVEKCLDQRRVHVAPQGTEPGRVRGETPVRPLCDHRFHSRCLQPRHTRERERQSPSTMAEQTEKAFLKQPKVFLSSKKSGKGKRPGKGGNRFWKSIGLGFKTPREAVEGTYIDKKCPFTGTVSVRGRILAGTCHSAKMIRTIIVRRNYLHFIKKYQRYEKRHSNIPAHISPCFRVKEGDHVIIGQCRPLSKTVRFNVLKVIPAGSSGGGKKAFTGM